MKYQAPNGEVIEFENDNNLKTILEREGFKPVEEVKTKK